MVNNETWGYHFIASLVFWCIGMPISAWVYTRNLYFGLLGFFLCSTPLVFCVCEAFWDSLQRKMRTGSYEENT